MKPKFENNVARTKALYKEVYSYFYFKKPFTLVIMIFMWICFAANIVLLLQGLEYTLYAFFIPPLFTAYLVYAYYHQVSMITKREKELYGGELSVVTTVFEDSLTSTTSAGNETTMDLKNIVKVKNTKNYILVISKAKLMYIFDKNGFTVGDAESFAEFLKSKCTKK